MAPQQKKTASPKKIAAKKTSLKTKRSAKVVESLTKKDCAKGKKKKTISNTVEERAARAAWRSLKTPVQIKGDIRESTL